MTKFRFFFTLTVELCCESCGKAWKGDNSWTGGQTWLLCPFQHTMIHPFFSRPEKQNRMISFDRIRQHFWCCFCQYRVEFNRFEITENYSPHISSNLTVANNWIWAKTMWMHEQIDVYTECIFCFLGRWIPLFSTVISCHGAVQFEWNLYFKAQRIFDVLFVDLILHSNNIVKKKVWTSISYAECICIFCAFAPFDARTLNIYFFLPSICDCVAKVSIYHEFSMAKNPFMFCCNEIYLTSVSFYRDEKRNIKFFPSAWCTFRKISNYRFYMQFFRRFAFFFSLFSISIANGIQKYFLAFSW